MKRKPKYAPRSQHEAQQDWIGEVCEQAQNYVTIQRELTAKLDAISEAINELSAWANEDGLTADHFDTVVKFFRTIGKLPLKMKERLSEAENRIDVEERRKVS